jgi:hypothetical protein
VLCPEFAEIFNDPIKGTKTENIQAIEAYAKAICQKLAKQYDATITTPAPKTTLSEHVRNHLEKVAAKDFTPTFQGGNKPLSFETLIEHAKHTTEKYANVTKEHKDLNQFAESQESKRDANKIARKQNQDTYKDLVKAKIKVYEGFEFIDNQENPNEFMLRNTKANQNIIVTKNPTNGKFLIQGEYTAEPINDETLGIMVELLHSVLRFSEPNKKMNVKIKGVAADSEITKKIEEGLKIITDGNQEIKAKLNYNQSGQSGKG